MIKRKIHDAEAQISQLEMQAEGWKREAARLKAENERLRAALESPSTVHINMLRGVIAKPTLAQIIHLYGEDALRAALAAQPAPSPWRPIDGAPEFQNVLVCDAEGWRACGWLAGDNRWYWLGGEETPIIDPVGWMPLPPAPKEVE